MKAITVIQPWASFLACGIKCIETRTWSTDYRGPLLIHASRSRLSRVDEQKLMSREAFQYAMHELRKVFGMAVRRFRDLPTGAVVGMCKIHDVQSTTAFVPQNWGTHELGLGDFGRGRWAWIMRDQKRVEPIECRGKLQLWTPPRRVIEKVKAA